MVALLNWSGCNLEDQTNCWFTVSRDILEFGKQSHFCPSIVDIELNNVRNYLVVRNLVADCELRSIEFNCFLFAQSFCCGDRVLKDDIPHSPVVFS